MTENENQPEITEEEAKIYEMKTRRLQPVEENEDDVLQDRYVECFCGSVVVKKGLSKHKKSEKHLLAQLKRDTDLNNSPEEKPKSRRARRTIQPTITKTKEDADFVDDLNDEKNENDEHTERPILKGRKKKQVIQPRTEKQLKQLEKARLGRTKACIKRKLMKEREEEEYKKQVKENLKKEIVDAVLDEIPVKQPRKRQTRKRQPKPQQVLYDDDYDDYEPRPQPERNFIDLKALGIL